MRNDAMTLTMVIVYSLALVVGWFTIEAARSTVVRINRLTTQVELLQKRVEYLDADMYVAK